jgi:DNA-binding transcriptional LysR family regulator
MNLEALKGFLAVCRHGSFTEAANTLFLTQPAVSQQVKSLEDEFGTKLLEKRGKGFRLTPAGEEVRTGAEDVFSRIDRMVEAVDEIKGLIRGRLSVAAGDTIVMYMFPGWMKKFTGKFPGIDLYLAGQISADVEEMVRRGECDLGLITMPPSSSDLASEMLPSEELCLILPGDHPVAEKKRIDLKTITGLPRIALGRRSKTRRLIEDAFASKGLEWKPLTELNGFEIIKRYVAAGLGAAIVPRMALKQGEGYAIRNLPRSFPKQELGIIYRKDQYLTKPMQALIEIIKKG